MYVVIVEVCTSIKTNEGIDELKILVINKSKLERILFYYKIVYCLRGLNAPVADPGLIKNFPSSSKASNWCV